MLVASSRGQDFYAIPINSIDGKKIDLNSYQGMKVLIVIIPLNDRGTAAIEELANFKATLGNKIAVIGIPSIEEGYQKSDDITLKKLYKQDRNIDILITEGVKVKKGSGTAQAELMKWLTDYKRNGHFDTDVQGAGDKFFVSETGKLYAVLSPQMSLFGRAMTAIVNQPGGN
jgi:glutathione peroxidase-family protein